MTKIHKPWWLKIIIMLETMPVFFAFCIGLKTARHNFNIRFLVWHPGIFRPALSMAAVEQGGEAYAAG